MGGNTSNQSSMLKKLKSLFIEEDSAAEITTPAKNESNAPTVNIHASIPTVTAGIPSQAPLDQRILDSLRQALEANNQEGFDFLEFKESLRTLATIIPDEGTRYKSAFATAKTLGVTVEKLLQSASFYQEVLERERTNFSQALSQQVDLNVTTQQKEVERLRSLIDQKSQEIARLTQEITAYQAEMSKAQGIIVEAQTKIEATQQDFAHTLDMVLNQIQIDINNIQRYLQS